MRDLPLTNTILLLYSGVAITMAHGYLLQNPIGGTFNPRATIGFAGYLATTIALGVLFLLLQYFEYKRSLRNT
jgi:heme/copper-type cytochrome/quinol oxidase subunit 3